MSFSFINTVGVLNKQNAIKKISVVDKRIPTGKEKGVTKYIKRKTIKIEIDFSKDLGFLDDLPDDMLVQIGDTYYQKGGSCFKYEYNNQSSDYQDSLTDMANNGDIYIFLKGGYENDQNC